MLRFSISSPSLQSFLSNSTMSSSRFSARGRNPWHRGFCCRTPWDGGDHDHPIVSGDSHFNNVRDDNYAHRQGYRGNYSNPRGSFGQPQFRPRPQYRPRPQQQFHPQSHLHPYPQGPQPQFRPNPQPQFRQNPQQQFRPNPQLYFRPHTHPPDDHRKWIYATSQPPPQCERLTVLSYNILADYLARDHRSKLYFHIPHHILDWEWRKKRLFLEFGLWAPDIMCLQEVDRFHDLENELAIRGYAGIWKMRTGDAIDGCAIFWRTNGLQLRHEEHIEFNKLGLRDNVAQICVLELTNRNPAENSSTSSPQSSGQSSGVKQVVICNIHVLYNPKRGEMKLGQVRRLLDRAYAVSKSWNDAPVIVCGDFNSTPESPMYKFISEQKLSLSGLARDQISGQYAVTIYTPRPYVDSGLYRPQHSIDNCTEAKDVQQGDNFKGVDTHHKPDNDVENTSENDKLSSPYIMTGMASENFLSDSQTTIEVNKLSDIANEIDEVGTLNACSGGDTSSLSRLVNPSQRKDESCEVRSEIPLNMGDFSNPSFSNNEPWSGEFHLGEVHLELGGDSSATQAAHSTQSMLSGCPSQMNEGIPNELISHDLDTSSDSALCQELKDSLHREKNMSKTDLATLVLPTQHEDLSGRDILKDNSNGEHSPLPEDNQCDMPPENTLFDEGLINSNLNDFGTTKEAGIGNLWQNTCRSDQLYSSTCNNSINQLYKTMVEDFHSDGDCENTGSDKMVENVYGAIETKSEEPNKFPEKSNFAGESYRVQSGDHDSFSQDGNVIDESSSLGENSDPNFFKELTGTEDARVYAELYGDKNFSFSPSHKSGDAEPTSKKGEDPSYPGTSPAADMEKYYYNPYLWTPMEIEAASGNAGSSFVEHRLKLRSAYADVEDFTGTKGPSREPAVTSYNRLFMGAVDYIWYSEGLQTVKVLDTIPKHILQRTPGFPTRRWGSDHLALACEFACSLPSCSHRSNPGTDDAAGGEFGEAVEAEGERCEQEGNEHEREGEVGSRASELAGG